jgi:ADP-L-glycero-D-manno-heptose 6-epimerase
MIVLTGAAGFIGSCLLRHLNDMGITNIMIVDDFSKEEKRINYEEKKYSKTIDRQDFIPYFKQNHRNISFIIHLGARTDTTEKNTDIFNYLNLNYSKEIWKICSRFEIPLIYASSAATYGLGELGYEDNHGIVSDLKPLNPYGDSKNDFDRWALEQDEKPTFWAGLKFFNVYGPNEYHKGRMASVIFHTAKKIKASGEMQLFKSHRPDFKDGEQSRDFVYVKDVLKVIEFLMNKKAPNGIYNLGTGKARTFYDLAKNTFSAMGIEPKISFVDTPEDIRDTYQYFTEANMQKLRNAGYQEPFYTLEEGIDDYVKKYLMSENIF